MAYPSSGHGLSPFNEISIYMPKHLSPCQEDLDLLRDVDYVVEADSYARLSLWLECQNMVGFTWEQLPGSVATTVGTLKKMPIVMTLNPARLLGVNVVFWDMCSLVTHAGIAVDWLKEASGAYRKKHYCDAMNFSHCINHIFSITGKDHDDYPRIWDVSGRQYTKEYSDYTNKQ